MSFKFNPLTGKLDLVGQGGGPGPGPTSVDQVVKTYVLGETVSALKIVRLGVDGRAYLADSISSYENTQAIGMTKTAGIENSVVEVVTFGVISDPLFSYTLNFDLFLTSLGNLSESISELLFHKRVGQSLGGNAILINIEDTIEL